MVAFFAVAPFFVYPVFLMKALCFALFACAFNLLIGYVGLLVVRPRRLPRLGGLRRGARRQGVGLAAGAGHPRRAPRRPPPSASSSGALAIRRQGIYFAMITLALAQMIYFFCLQAPFTGGEDGIQAVPRGTLFGLFDLRPDHDALLRGASRSSWPASSLIYRTIHSPFGQVLKAIRENEPRAISLGYQADHYKLIAFVLSATLSGLAGGTKAIVFQLASLTDVHWTMSGEVVLMTLLGGLGTVFGPVVGRLRGDRARELPGPARRLGHRRPGARSSSCACSRSAAASSASSPAS